jgi:hypothetical protein
MMNYLGRHLTLIIPNKSKYTLVHLLKGFIVQTSFTFYLCKNAEGKYGKFYERKIAPSVILKRIQKLNYFLTEKQKGQFVLS